MGEEGDEEEVKEKWDEVNKVVYKEEKGNFILIGNFIEKDKAENSAACRLIKYVGARKFIRIYSKVWLRL